MHVRMCVCMHVCMYICMYVFMHVFIYMYIFIYVYREGSEEKRKSFIAYQMEYKSVRRDFERSIQHLHTLEQQQRVQKITIKALEALTPTAAVYVPHGHEFSQKSILSQYAYIVSSHIQSTCQMRLRC
jgi:hypothetical protein